MIHELVFSGLAISRRIASLPAPSLLVCLLVGLLGAPMSARAQEPAPYAQRAAALIEPYLEAGLFSGAVLVTKDGKPIFRRAYGLANREWGIPNTLDTHFRIASLTKAFTAAAILQLAEAGKLGLDDPIHRFVPDAPAIWEGVTLRRLLQHSSGIINYTALASYLPKLSRIEQTPSEIVALTTAEPLLFEPGTRFEYSNTNYILLGMVVEAASGMPYARYLQEHLLGPLGLKDTDYDDVSAILPRRASGYRRGQAAWRNAAPTASSVPFAAGGLYSTVDDLAAWIRALISDKALSPASRDAMFTDGGFGYGLGWFVGKGNDRRLWSHGGSISGFLAIADIYSDDKLNVIVLANTETAPVQKMSRELAALQFGTLDKPEAIVLEPMILDRYVGTYRVGPRYFLTVTRDGGRLLARATGEPAYPFLPESDRTFFSPVFDVRITFETEPDGSRTGLVYHRNGRDWTAPPVDAEEARRALAEPPRAHNEVALDRAAMGRYLGRYALGPGSVVTIAMVAGRPYAQATGQPRNEMFQEAPGEFFLKAVDAQISFTVDGSGRTTGLVLHQNGLDTPAPRIAGDEAAAKVVKPSPKRR